MIIKKDYYEQIEYLGIVLHGFIPLVEHNKILLNADWIYNLYIDSQSLKDN